MQGVTFIALLLIVIATFRASARNILEFHNVESCTFHIQNFEKDTAMLNKIIQLNQYNQPWTVTSGNVTVDGLSDPRHDFKEICDITILINATHSNTYLSAGRINRVASIFLFVYDDYVSPPFQYITSAQIYYLYVGGQEESHQIFKYCNTCSGDWIQLPQSIQLWDKTLHPRHRFNLKSQPNFKEATIHVITRYLSQNDTEEFQNCANPFVVFASSRSAETCR